jgi:hypothetical protein
MTAKVSANMAQGKATVTEKMKPKRTVYDRRSCADVQTALLPVTHRRPTADTNIGRECANPTRLLVGA